jgi:nucleotide-binding universal stress UspA family protein
MKLFRRILVPYDYSPHARRALALAANLARDAHGRIVLLTVVPPYQPMMSVPGELAWLPPPPPIASERRALEAVAAQVVRGPRAPRVACRVMVGDPAQRIVEAARGVDAIVMATAGRTGLSHLLIGSVAEKVVRHSSIPVLTVRPPVARATRRARTRGTTRRAARRA